MNPKGTPDLKKAQKKFADLCVTIAWLRDPKSGCPWDLKQSYKTLRRYMIEEAYEAAEAMAAGDAAELCGELGDVLLQVVLNSQIAKDKKHFDISDVIDAINTKMRRRHPHVFAGADSVNWNAIKADEAREKGKKPKKKGVFADAEKKHPATAQAFKIGKLAADVKFDWDNAKQVLAQVRDEVEEMTVELERKRVNHAKVAEEIGDVYFSLAQLCRHLELDPETVSVDANRKFLRRFSALEKLAAKDELDVKDATRDQLEALWKRVKAKE